MVSSVKGVSGQENGRRSVETIRESKLRTVVSSPADQPFARGDKKDMKASSVYRANCFIGSSILLIVVEKKVIEERNTFRRVATLFVTETKSAKVVAAPRPH